MKRGVSTILALALAGGTWPPASAQLVRVSVVPGPVPGLTAVPSLLPPAPLGPLPSMGAPGVLDGLGEGKGSPRAGPAALVLQDRPLASAPRPEGRAPSLGRRAVGSPPARPSLAGPAWRARSAQVAGAVRLARPGALRSAPPERGAAVGEELFRRLVGLEGPSLAPLAATGDPLLEPKGEGRPLRVQMRPGTEPGEPEEPKAARGLGGLVRVLPDSQDNRRYWIYLFGQAFLSVGVQFHIVGLPGLAAPTQADSGRLGVLRVAHYGSQAVSSFATGPAVDRFPNKTLMVGNALALGAVLALVPAFYAMDAPMFLPLVGIMVARAFFQIFGLNAGEVAFTKIIRRHAASFNKANAMRILFGGLVAMGASLAAGRFLDALGGSLGLGANAWAYGVAAGMSALSGVFYLLFFRGREFAERGSPKTALRPSFGSTIKDFGGGFKVIAKHRFIWLSVLLDFVPMFALDSLVFMILPLYLKSIAGSAGAFGILMAAGALGATLAALAMVLWGGRRGKDDPARRLEREGKAAYLMSAVGSLLFWGLLFSGSVWLAAVFYGLNSLLASPSSVVWSSVVQHIVKDEPENMGKVYSAISVIWPVATALGAWAFGSLLTGITLETAMLLFGGLMTVNAAMKALGAFLLFPLDRGRKAPKTPKTARASLFAAPAYA